MTIRKAKPTTPGRRGMSFADFSEITRDHPERSLVVPKPRKAGRNVHGRITTRHQGGGHKQQYRLIDFRRDKDAIPAKVAHIEYDPNRSARIALLHYADGEKRYILAAQGVSVGEIVPPTLAPVFMIPESVPEWRGARSIVLAQKAPTVK